MLTALPHSYSIIVDVVYMALLIEWLVMHYRLQLIKAQCRQAKLMLLQTSQLFIV